MLPKPTLISEGLWKYLSQNDHEEVVRALASARAEGFAKAREMALARTFGTITGTYARIETMQDEGACRGCGHRPHPSGSCGVSGVDGAGCQCTIRGDVP